MWTDQGERELLHELAEAVPGAHLAPRDGLVLQIQQVAVVLAALEEGLP
jgi:hypothetical protein